MDSVTRTHLDELFASTTSPAISMYLPTTRGPAAQHHDSLVVKNLIGQARDSAAAAEHDASTIDSVLRPLDELVSDHGWWVHRELGIAAFSSPSLFAAYRVPVAFETEVTVADNFLAGPLLAVLSGGDRFHILGLSLNHVRLMWGNRFEVGEIDLGRDVPTSLAEALWFEEPESSLQSHQTQTSGGRVVAHFHGHGLGRDKIDRRRKRFFRLVDDGLSSVIDVDVPLVLAGVDEGVNQYRSVSRHPAILPLAVTGNVDRMSPAELHASAWPVAEAWFTGSREAALRTYSDGSRPVAATVDELGRLAPEGRVESLFVSHNALFGRGDGASTPEVRRNIEHVIAHTWKHRGVIHVVDTDDIPGGGSVAATLRY